jgi:hypothetical protein
MIGNAIKMTTSTTGTGNLSLSSVANYPTFADAFALNQLVSYSLLDSNGLFLEAGVGYLSATTTFVRARVTATYSGGTYTDESPSAVNLSGTTTVICTPHAATMEAMLPTVDGQTAGLNRFLSPANRNTASTTLATPVLRCYYVPFLLRCGAPIGSLSFNVTGAGAASTVARVGIYGLKSNGYMGDLMATTGDVATDTTGLKTTSLASAIFLAPGWYYTAFVCSGSPTVTAWTGSPSNIFGGSPLGFSGATAVDTRHETLASAVLPSTANTSTTAITAGNTNLPAVWMGVST